MINTIFGIKGIAVTAGLSFILGTAGGGWAINKFWIAKAHKQEIQTLKAEIDAQKDLRDNEARLRKDAEARADGLDAMLQDSRATLLSREDYIAELIRQRPVDRQTIIREGEKIGTEIEGDYPWLRYPWPDRMRDYANGRDIPDMPASSKDAMGSDNPRTYP